MKILFTHLGRIGDLILATPALHKLKESYPEAKLELIAGSSNYAVVKNDPILDNILIYDKNPLKLTYFFFKLKSRKYTIYIDPKDHPSSESKMIAKAVRAKQKIGLKIDEKSPFDTEIRTDTENFGKHHVELSLQALSPLGIEYSEIPKPILFSDSESDKYVIDFFKSHNIYGRPLIAFNISGSHERKMWQNEKWIEFFRKTELSCYEIALIYAPSERNRAQELSLAVPKLHIFNSRNINDVISIVSKSVIVLTVDTAIVHIAAAFNKPIFALYSGIEKFWHKFKPLSDIYQVVRAAPHDNGVHSISVSQVLDQWDKFLRKIKSI